jgi:hypothetical protein
MFASNIGLVALAVSAAGKRMYCTLNAFLTGNFYIDYIAYTVVHVSLLAKRCVFPKAPKVGRRTTESVSRVVKPPANGVRRKSHVIFIRVARPPAKAPFTGSQRLLPRTPRDFTTVHFASMFGRVWYPGGLTLENTRLIIRYTLKIGRIASAAAAETAAALGLAMSTWRNHASHTAIIYATNNAGYVPNATCV